MIKFVHICLPPYQKVSQSVRHLLVPYRWCYHLWLHNFDMPLIVAAAECLL